jgi:uncharacterized DUF497 family protein/uncharacterized protein (DUF4415 family)
MAVAPMQRFEWDETKAKRNLRKHGIDFEDAVTVFRDENVVIELERYVDDEARWQALGMIDGAIIVIVVHGIREEGLTSWCGSSLPDAQNLTKGDAMGKIIRRTWEEMENHKVSPEAIARMKAIKDEDIDFSDIPPLTEKFWKNAVRNPLYRPVKKQVTVRIDADVLEWLKQKAETGYQSRLNAVLRKEMLEELGKKSA